MPRKMLFFVSLLLGIVALLIYQSRQTEPIYHTQSYVFGTLVDVTIYGETEARAIEVSNEIVQDFQRLHQTLHAWKTNKASTNASTEKPDAIDTQHMHTSESTSLVAINASFAAGANEVSISNEMAFILQDVQRLSTQSQGLFNPAIGHLIAAWGFQRDTFTPVVAKPEAIASLRKAQPQMANIDINQINKTVLSRNSAVKLDLGGYAKGYALDLAFNHLKKANVQHALINIGGNIIALGQHGKKPWRVGIQHPRQPNAIATVMLPSGWAIGTSGDYQRYFMRDGVRYCHIINPSTGYPVQHTQAVTVLVPPQPVHKSQAGVLSDVASKPIFIAEVNQKPDLAEAMQVRDYMIIDAKGNISVSPTLAKKLNWLNPNEAFTILSSH